MVDQVILKGGGKERLQMKGSFDFEVQLIIYVMSVVLVEGYGHQSPKICH